MNKIKKGSSVVKKAGNKEIVFVVEKIFSEKRKKIAILKGLCIRKARIYYKRLNFKV